MRRSQAVGGVALVTLTALSVVALAALAVAAAQILGGGEPVVAWTAGPDACAEIVGAGASGARMATTTDLVASDCNSRAGGCGGGCECG